MTFFKILMATYYKLCSNQRNNKYDLILTYLLEVLCMTDFYDISSDIVATVA